MILYINGDSHTTAAEAINQYTVAGEDQKYLHLGTLPHPENMAVSWSKLLSASIRASLHCGAFAHNTVESIISSTQDWIKDKGRVDLMIIQWPATQDDEEKIWWFHQELNRENIKHIFFNSSYKISDRFEWDNIYIPETYENIIQSAKIDTVLPNSKHFGKDGHAVWNRFLLNYIITNNFI